MIIDKKSIYDILSIPIRAVPNCCLRGKNMTKYVSVARVFALLLAFGASFTNQAQAGSLTVSIDGTNTSECISAIAEVMKSEKSDEDKLRALDALKAKGCKWTKS